MGFDEFSKEWDTEKRISRARIISKEMENFIPIDQRLSAMEFGCGTGLISFNLHDKLKEITLIDSSEGMLDVVKSKIETYKVNNVIIKKLDISINNVFDKRYDIIYSSMVLHHINDTNSIVNKLYELLNKEGYLCIIDLNKEDGSFHKNEAGFHGHNGFDQAELIEIFENAGLKEVKAHTFYLDTKDIGDEVIEYSLFIIKGIK
ncbi:class I SAM-dependent DNA methyltransferase [Clostridium folliculivorans]|uniref:S-adenosylmethionine-dependent methyltransferase n=1 Tax=Clostridium folliculivorans TaxID=2886038 RepID=A0A9W5Y127_9CLOT|nr:class I SAM-dependent methyltransferase [Clostridium folliculivorans]GKU24673.1 S-adenosylmethionine-dependent methyltransferase [Clostridium folliculivorans]GKU30771.1 S-adenosylmethionine-dependent methyltransferase [Clostridium folliculivorans]